MQHPDSDDELLAALRGNQLDADASAEELAAGRIGDIARSMDETSIPSAPTDLWAGIEAEISEPVDQQEPASLAERRDRKARSAQPIGLRFLAAAAAVALLAGLAGWWIGAREESPATQQLANVELDALVDEGQASAALVEQDSSLYLELSLADIDPADGYFEVWLLSPEVDQLVSLGPVRDDGRYELPTGLDPTTVPVVDVSIEPFDGSPEHSGNSVFRGALDL